jgi:hypothetical protein
MGKSRLSPFGVSIGLLLLVSGGIGCGGAKGPSQSPEAVHIVKVSDLVEEFKTAHQNNPPADLEELKSWALKEGKAQESDFESTRDKQPYELALSAGTGKPKKGSQLSVREATGKNGMRFMSTSGSGTASEMSENVFKYMGGEALKANVPKTGGPPKIQTPSDK